MNHLGRVGAALLALAVLAAVALTLDPAQVAAALADASVPLLAVAVVLYLPSWGLRGWRWQQLAADLGDRLPLVDCVALATVGNMLNLALPAKSGDLLWANAAHQRWGVPYGRAMAGVLAGRVLDLVVLIALGVVAAAGLPEAGARLGAAPVPASLAALAVLALGWWAAVHRGLGRCLLVGPLRRLRGLHDALAEPLARLSRTPLQLTRHGGLTAVIWAVEALVAWVVARALGVELGPAAALFAVFVANLSKIVPLTPASFGTYEAAGGLALVAAGVDYDRAVAVMLAEHLLKNVVNLALGLVAVAARDTRISPTQIDDLRRAWRATLVERP